MMNRSRVLALVLAGFALFAPETGAMSAQNGPQAMVTGSVTSQPIGHYEFCRVYKVECAVRTKLQQAPRLTPHGWTMVQVINGDVNRAIIPMTDREIFGREEVWSYPTEVGDCEDFVLLKRKKLMEAGFSPADLLITVVRKPDGEGHAVLTLRTSQGDFVLDNLVDDVKLWVDTPYTYLKRQASFDTGRWVSIENGRDVLVGALK